VQLNNVVRPIISSGQMQVAQATIKSSKKVFDMFSDQTYANKPVAIARELVANGIDAHTAAGTPEIPVEVTLPTELEPEFKVKDHGTGMAHDFVMGPFMAYTDGSTKDQSNDQIGGFGIGSKSPFAYTDQFTLRVVHNAVLSVYTMFKDADGIPSVGLVAQTTTDESNGVEVSFPVELDDMDDFRSAAQTALQFFNPLPTITNGSISAPDYSHVSAAGKWAMRPQSGPLGVIMGGVRYPVSTDSLPWSVRRDSKAAPLLDYGIDLTLPIGSVDIAISREALSYTERTGLAIAKAMSGIVDEVAETFATLFDHHKTKWSAQVDLYNQLSNLGGSQRYGSNGGRTGMLRNYAKYKGEQLHASTDFKVKTLWNRVTQLYDAQWPKDFPKGASAWQASKRTYGVNRGIGTPKFQTLGDVITEITPGAWPVVLIDDMVIAGKSRTRARIEQYLETHNKSGALVLRAADNTNAKSIKQLLDFLGGPTNTVTLSSLPEPARMVRTVGSGAAAIVRPRVRMFTYNGERDLHGNTVYNLSPARAKRDVVKEIAYADQPTTGILVELTAWSFPDGFISKMKSGIIKWDELLFVNTSDAPKLKAVGFEKFDDVYQPRLDAEKGKYPNLGEWLATANHSGLAKLFTRIRRIRDQLTLTAAQEATPFGQILKLYDDNIVPLTGDVRMLAVAADIVPIQPANVDFDKLIADFETKQPFAKQVLGLFDYSSDDKNGALLLNNL
jgi:hypothetical protein